MGPSPRSWSCTVSSSGAPVAISTAPMSARPSAAVAVGAVACRRAASATRPVATSARTLSPPSAETVRTSTFAPLPLLRDTFTAGRGYRPMARSLQRELREQSDRLDLAAADAERADRRGLPRGDTVANPLARADQRDLVDQLVGHCGHRRVPVAAEEGVLDPDRRLLVAEPLGVVVVEILVARAHAADVEREHRLHRVAALLEVVPDDAGDERRDVEVRQALASARRLEARLDVRREHRPLLRRHPDGEEAVGQLGRGLHARGADRGGVDRQVRAPVQNALQRLAEAGRAGSGVRKLILLSSKLGGFLALEDLADDLDVLAGAGERLSVAHAVPALDDLRTGRSEAQDEAAA